MEDRWVDFFLASMYVILIIARITNIITISWFWILAPFWLIPVLAGAGLVITLILCITMIIIERVKRYKNERY